MKDRVEQLLSQQVPWSAPSPQLRGRVANAMSGVRPAAAPRKLWAGALLIAMATTGAVVYMRPIAPANPEVGAVRVPDTVLNPLALNLLASSAEEKFESEAREILEDTERLTRRVLAQLPFTGGG